MKRSRRLETGIDSLQQQIEFHKRKRDKAKAEGNMELVSYYDKEVEALEQAKERKEKQLKR
jgi:hypothetical protein